MWFMVFQEELYINYPKLTIRGDFLLRYEGLKSCCRKRVERCGTNRGLAIEGQCNAMRCDKLMVGGSWPEV